MGMTLPQVSGSVNYVHTYVNMCVAARFSSREARDGLVWRG